MREVHEHDEAAAAFYRRADGGVIAGSRDEAAAIHVNIARSVAVFDTTRFVILGGDFGTQGDHTKKSSEGAHDQGGQHRKNAEAVPTFVFLWVRVKR